VLDLIATDENIFGVMDVNEEPIGDGVGLEDLSSDDIEAAIAAELGGGKR
jgi:DNA-directed RNA polymerase subunit omega